MTMTIRAVSNASFAAAASSTLTITYHGPRSFEYCHSGYYHTYFYRIPWELKQIFKRLLQLFQVISPQQLQQESSLSSRQIGKQRKSWKPSNFKSPWRTTIHKKTSVSMAPSNCQTSQDQSNKFALLVMPLTTTKPDPTHVRWWPQEAQQGQEIGQEACQEVRCFPCFWILDQTNPTSFGCRFEQGWWIPNDVDPSRWYA